MANEKLLMKQIKCTKCKIGDTKLDCNTCAKDQGIVVD